MSDYAFTITAGTPLALRAGRSSEQSATLAYLPGPSLLGALAAAHRQLYSDRDEEFAQFFLRRRIVVSDAYPASFPDGPLTHPRWPVAPLPATARTCKRFPGFAEDTTRPFQPHGVVDQALAWTVFAASGERTATSLRGAATCRYPNPTCGEPVDPFGGFYRRAEARGKVLYGQAPGRVALRTSTGINRARGTVQQGVLFSRSVLVEGSRFWWCVRLDSALDRAFRTFVDEASELGVWRVGTGRTRGLGRLQAAEPEYLERDDAGTDAVRTRIDLFDARLREMARQVGVSLAHRCYVPITLTSDLVLRDPLLRWRTCLDSDSLTTAGIANADLVYHAARVHRVTGWNGALGLPQPDVAAIAMGSVFVFGFNGNPPYEALARVQADGLGLRREVGFGQVLVAGPIHYEVMQP